MKECILLQAKNIGQRILLKRLFIFRVGCIGLVVFYEQIFGYSFILEKKFGEEAYTDGSIVWGYHGEVVFL